MFYNERPYIYAIIGIIGLAFSKDSKLALTSGVVLLVCSGLIFYIRNAHKERNQETQAMHDQLTKDIKSKANDKIVLK